MYMHMHIMPICNNYVWNTKKFHTMGLLFFFFIGVIFINSHFAPVWEQNRFAFLGIPQRSKVLIRMSVVVLLTLYSTTRFQLCYNGSGTAGRKKGERKIFTYILPSPVIYRLTVYFYKFLLFLSYGLNIVDGEVHAPSANVSTCETELQLHVVLTYVYCKIIQYVKSCTLLHYDSKRILLTLVNTMQYYY